MEKIPSVRFGYNGLSVFCHQSNDCIVVGRIRQRTEEGQFSFLRRISLFGQIATGSKSNQLLPRNGRKT